MREEEFLNIQNKILVIHFMLVQHIFVHQMNIF